MRQRVKEIAYYAKPRKLIMTIAEFANRYNLHDSYIEAVKYDPESRSVVLTIQFLFWMQNDYVEGSPETGLLYVTFHNASRYSCENENPADPFSGILTAECKNGDLILKLMNDKTGRYFEVVISAEDVTLEKGDDDSDR